MLAPSKRHLETPMAFYLVCYDIEDDRERTRVHNILAAHGDRVQYSVFELDLSDKDELDQVKREIEAELEGAADGVRFYRLCTECRRASDDLDGQEIATRNLAVIV